MKKINFVPGMLLRANTDSIQASQRSPKGFRHNRTGVLVAIEIDPESVRGAPKAIVRNDRGEHISIMLCQLQPIEDKNNDK